MNISKLQSFATSARTQLMTGVKVRLDEALAPDSSARIDMPLAFQQLTDEIAELGGGEEGRDRLVERYAYRWFNRIIAFRYMDIKGFTDTPVVSTVDLSSTIALPEILAAAKRGEYDPDVFDSDIPGNVKTRQTIEGLFNGTIQDDDPQGRAYGLLLQAHSRYWHKLMPFMFETGGSVDELLMPTNMLAADSVLRQATVAMGIKDCKQGVEIIGWLYQFYISERKDEVMDGFRNSQKAGAAEIPAATQLFTPNWIVRYLVQNSAGRLWMQNHPESKLAQGWEYYIKPESDTTADEGDHSEHLRIDSPEGLTVCDPACGSGHFLTYAFDLLSEIYTEQGYASSEIPCLILIHNLFGMEIDERAAELASFALMMKAREQDHRFFHRHNADGMPIMPHIQQITREHFTSDEAAELNKMYGVNLSNELWNTYAHADVFGSLIEPDTKLKNVAEQSSLLPSTDTKEQSIPSATSSAEQNTEIDLPLDLPFDLGPTTLFSADLQNRVNTVLTQTRYLSRQYAAVVANPPYMGSSNMGNLLKKFVTDNFKDGKADLMTCFMIRAHHLSKRDGFWAMINLPSWLALASFENLRKNLLDKQYLCSFLDLGRGIFGSDFGSVAFVFQNQYAKEQEGYYRRLFDNHVDVRPVDKIKQLFFNASYHVYRIKQSEFCKIPSSPIVYWLPNSLIKVFDKKIAKGISGDTLSDISDVAQGITTGDNSRFLRFWWESSINEIDFSRNQLQEEQTGRWVPCNKGGEFRRWFGNNAYIIDWIENGQSVITFKGSTPRNKEASFKRAVVCSKITSGQPSFRFQSTGYVFTDAAISITDAKKSESILGILNSTTATTILNALSPTLNFEVGQLRSLPVLDDSIEDSKFQETLNSLVKNARDDWNSFENSSDFQQPSFLYAENDSAIEIRIRSYYAIWQRISNEQQSREILNNKLVADAYGVRDDVECDVPLDRVSLKRNAAFTYPGKSSLERKELFARDTVKELISYAVGCMFGRYSIDKSGLILASQGETLDDYHVRVPDSRFEPDEDNVIPITTDERFEDDIVTRFKQWLKIAFGQEHLTENLAYIEQTLGKNLRQYFMNDFYEDHVKMYQNRPIYWMYSSTRDKRGAFKALVYLHRYTPHTTHTVLRYLRDFRTSVDDEIARLSKSDEVKAARQADKLRRASVECKNYEDNVLYPLAIRNLAIDLDDGVLVNYLRLGDALCKIPPIEKKRKTVAKWTWPVHSLEDVSD